MPPKGFLYSISQGSPSQLVRCGLLWWVGGSLRSFSSGVVVFRLGATRSISVVVFCWMFVCGFCLEARWGSLHNVFNDLKRNLAKETNSTLKRSDSTRLDH